jgi:hypothetical protein
MQRTSPSIFRLGPCLPLILGFFLFPGADAAWSRQGEQAVARPAPVLEVKFKGEPQAGQYVVSLDSFYLIEDGAARSRVRRIDLALELARPEAAQQADLQGPRLREALYDFLTGQEREHPRLDQKDQGRALAGIINRCLGQDAVSNVKVEQSILLLR